MGGNHDPPDGDLTRISREIEIHTDEMRAIAATAAAAWKRPRQQRGREPRRWERRDGVPTITAGEREYAPRHARPNDDEEGLLDFLMDAR